MVKRWSNPRSRNQGQGERVQRSHRSIFAVASKAPMGPHLERSPRSDSSKPHPPTQSHPFQGCRIQTTHSRYFSKLCEVGYHLLVSASIRNCPSMHYSGWWSVVRVGSTDLRESGQRGVHVKKKRWHILHQGCKQSRKHHSPFLGFVLVVPPA